MYLNMTYLTWPISTYLKENAPHLRQRANLYLAPGRRPLESHTFTANSSFGWPSMHVWNACSSELRPPLLAVVRLGCRRAGARSLGGVSEQPHTRHGWWDKIATGVSDLCRAITFKQRARIYLCSDELVFRICGETNRLELRLEKLVVPYILLIFVAGGWNHQIVRKCHQLTTTGYCPFAWWNILYKRGLWKGFFEGILIC